MKKSKAAPLTASLLARKGEARPAKTQVTIYDLTKPNVDGGPGKVESEQLSLDDGGVMVPAGQADPATEPAAQAAPDGSDESRAEDAETATEPSMAEVMSAPAPETAPVQPEPDAKPTTYGPITIVATTEPEPVAATEPDTAADAPAQPVSTSGPAESAPASASTNAGDDVQDEVADKPGMKAGNGNDASAAKPMDLAPSQVIAKAGPVESAANDETTEPEKDAAEARARRLSPLVRPTMGDKETDPSRLAPPYMPRSGAEERSRADRERKRYALMGGAALAAAGIVVTMWFAYNIGIEQAEDAGQRVIEAAAIRGERFPPVAAETPPSANQVATGGAVDEPVAQAPAATLAAPVAADDVAKNAKDETDSVAANLLAAIEGAADAASQKVRESVVLTAPVPEPASIQIQDPESTDGAQSVTVKVPLPPDQKGPETETEAPSASVPAPESPKQVTADTSGAAAVIEESKAAEKKIAAVLPAGPVAPAKTRTPAPTPPLPTKSLAAAKAESAGSNGTGKATRTASLTPTATPTGEFAIQISSVRSEAAAKKEWGRLQRVHGDLLKNLPVRYEKAAIKDKGIYFRVQAGELERGAARKLCAQLKQRKQGCLVVKR